MNRIIIPSVIAKTQEELDIEVDGGIQPHTIEKAKEAGANLFVCGSYLITAENNEERIKRINILKNLIQED